MAQRTYSYLILTLGLVVPFLSGWSVLAYLLSYPNDFVYYAGILLALGFGFYLTKWAEAVYHTVKKDLDTMKITVRDDKDAPK